MLPLGNQPNALGANLAYPAEQHQYTMKLVQLADHWTEPNTDILQEQICGKFGLGTFSYEITFTRWNV